MLIKKSLGCVGRTPLDLPYYYLLLNNPVFIAYSIQYCHSLMSSSIYKSPAQNMFTSLINILIWD